MDKDYEYRIDKIFGSSLWKHRTLRTLFDPGSHEWTETEIPKKLEYLKAIVDSGEDLERLLREYKMRYKEQKKLNIIDNLQDGLTILLQNAISTF